MGPTGKISGRQGDSESVRLMIFGDKARAAGLAFKALVMAFAIVVVPQSVSAQAPVVAASAPAVAAPMVPAAAPAVSAPANDASSAVGPVLVPGFKAGHFDVAPGGYTPMKPTPGKGMPIPGAIGFQKQYSPIGEYGLWFHDTILIWLCVIISVFVLGLLLYVVVRFNAKRNPVPSKTSHNTFIEIVWTLLPVLILVGVAVPSIDLLAKQFKPAPAHSLTVKATGNQWFWSYTYPDNGGIEIVSNMLPEEEAIKRGEPSHLAADYRMVVPVGEPIRMQITGADVIHSFAVPSLWFKLDGGSRADQREGVVHQRARRLLWPVLGTVRRAPWLYADRGRSAAPRPVQRLGQGAAGRGDRRYAQGP